MHLQLLVEWIRLSSSALDYKVGQLTVQENTTGWL